jgi:hypothetical protein
MPLLRTGFISLKFRYYDDRAFHVNEKGAHKKKHLVLVILSLGGRNSWAIQESVTVWHSFFALRPSSGGKAVGG